MKYKRQSNNNNNNNDLDLLGLLQSFRRGKERKAYDGDIYYLSPFYSAPKPNE